MAKPVIMPKQGNSVETVILTAWTKQVGEVVSEGEALCEVETDKAVMDVESTAAGTVLALFYQPGDEIPVMVNIAVVGQPGEDFSSFDPRGGSQPAEADSAPASQPAAVEIPAVALPSALPAETASEIFISPRARELAKAKNVDYSQLTGSGPQGRIIERDILAALQSQPSLSPVAKAMLENGDFNLPEQGSGPRGRIMSKDLLPAAQGQSSAQPAAEEPEYDVIPLKGMRKLIAERMIDSVLTTAQLTFNASADARALLSLRRRYKDSPESYGLRKVTINDLVMFAVSRVLLDFPDINAHLVENQIRRFKNVHLAFAVDTPRGLTVPVIRNAHTLSPAQISAQANRLAAACQTGVISPDELGGGTFTVTNLGGLGIESFTPILNPPQVAILGVNTIQLKPVRVGGAVEFIDHISFSLTVNHQWVDGAPSARFLKAVVEAVTHIDLLLAQ